jgi:predicted transcriptional regulator
VAPSTAGCDDGRRYACDHPGLDARHCQNPAQPLIERSNYVAGESQRLVDRLFGGKLSPLVAHLAEREALSADDIAEIEALIKGLKA